MATHEGVQIDTSTHEGVAVVSPQGDVDMSSSPDLRTALKGAIAQGRPKLVVDLSQVHYMDSSGMATLVEAMRMCKDSRAKMVICAMNEKVKALFEIARLDQFFTIVETLDEAIAG